MTLVLEQITLTVSNVHDRSQNSTVGSSFSLCLRSQAARRQTPTATQPSRKRAPPPRERARPFISAARAGLEPELPPRRVESFVPVLRMELVDKCAE